MLTAVILQTTLFVVFAIWIVELLGQRNKEGTEPFISMGVIVGGILFAGSTIVLWASYGVGTMTGSF